jgi:hypothetical protein
MSKKVADIIVETLESAGVKHCYGIVGDTLNLIARALSRSSIECGSQCGTRRPVHSRRRLKRRRQVT